MKTINPNLIEIAQRLSDGQYHNGALLGKELNISRAAIWKSIQKLMDYGLPITSIKGKGYLLETPCALMDPEKIKAHLKNKEIELVVLESISSTMHYPRRREANNHPLVCVVENQTQGKGRLNREWYSPFGQNIYLSLQYYTPKEISELSGLSLVIGLALCQAIEKKCTLPEPTMMKWPNDVLAQGKKCAGILIEIKAQSYGYTFVNIGVGLNVNMQISKPEEISKAWTSLAQLSGRHYDRNPLCAEMINQMFAYLKRFEENGLQDFMPEWQTKDALKDQPIELHNHQKTYKGQGAGINPQGYLILTMPDGTQQSFAAGDATLSK